MGGPAGGDDVGQVLGDLGAGTTGGQGAEVDRAEIDGVHADPVAEQGAATLRSRGVDRDDGDLQLALLVSVEASQQLVRERGLAGATRARDAQHRRRAAGGGRMDLLAPLLGRAALLESSDRSGQFAIVSREHVVECRHVARRLRVALLDHRRDHPDQAHALAVLRGEDAHALLGERRDLLGHDDAAAAAVDTDMAGPRGLQQLAQVGEVLDVPALIGRHRDALHVLLDGRAQDVLDAAVMAQVDHLAPLGLQDPPHDVDRCVVAVEEACGGDEADGMARSAILGHGVAPHPGSRGARTPGPRLYGISYSRTSKGLWEASLGSRADG